MFEPREFIAQNDKVVSLVYAEATVRKTGRAVVNHEAHVWTFRDGKLAQLQIYSSITAEAAAAHRVEYSLPRSEAWSQSDGPSVRECHPSELRCPRSFSVPGFRCGEVRLAVARHDLRDER